MLKRRARRLPLEFILEVEGDLFRGCRRQRNELKQGEVAWRYDSAPESAIRAWAGDSSLIAGSAGQSVAVNLQ